MLLAALTRDQRMQPASRGGLAAVRHGLITTRAVACSGSEPA